MTSHNFIGIKKMPLSALRGMLKNVKMGSVELKHAAAYYFIEKPGFADETAREKNK